MILPFLLAFAASQNLVVNGDFETNTSSGCDFNLSNSSFTSKMTGCIGYGTNLGSGELDIMEGGCGYGPDGPVGTTKIGLACDADYDVDAFTMTLSSPLSVGTTYTLSLWSYAYITSWAPSVCDVVVGLSTSAGTAGATIATFTPGTAGFAMGTATFTASVAATHISIAAEALVDGWTHVDGVVLEGGLHLDVSGACPGLNTATVTGATPGGSVAIGISAVAGSFVIPSGFLCAGTVLGLGGTPSLAAVLSADGSGTATLSGSVPAALCGYSVQAVDLTSCTTSNVDTL
jgi:hypothetical protein